MPGSGKSTVGRLIAKQAGLEFIDVDREVEARSGVGIPTIFEIEGEAGFRKREAATLTELTRLSGIVLATGGGAVLLEENRRLLRERGLVIYLQAPVDEILRRTAADKGRPLLQAVDPRARVEELLRQRAPLYEATAHIAFSSSAGNPRRLVKRICDHPLVQQLLNGPAA